LALKKLSDEDPTFKVHTDEETAETIISGMGELHLEIIADRMKRECKGEAALGKPRVAFKETIGNLAEAEGKYIRQSGGRGQYGHVFLRLEPQEQGKGFEFANMIKGASIPNEFIPAVEKGVKEAINSGVVAGYPVVDVKAVLYDGTYHEVDSSEAAFKIAASMAFKSAMKQATPFIIEPIMKVEIVTPEQFMGDVVGDLNSRRGQIENMEDRVQGTVRLKIVTGKVPLANMFGYATQLRSMSQGRATYTMEFSHYNRVPENISQGIIEGNIK